jgi:putative transcriptional regulator
MIITAGQHIKSTPLLAGSIFENTNLLICEVNENGAWGFIINKIFPRKLNELVEFQHCQPFPLYEGGPVEQEKLFFIHQRPDLIEGGKHIVDKYYWGGNFKQAIKHINAQTIEEKELQLFLGYCGWDDQQLQQEIAEGSWE